MIIVIDNHDSFVHNLARYLRLAGARTLVIRNDATDVDGVLSRRPSGVVVSPGPKAPASAGVCLDLLAAMPPVMPFLGICLGHQCLVEAAGGRTVLARRPMHGRAAEISHDGAGLFSGLPARIRVGRYHSLVGDLSDCAGARAGQLIASAVSDDGDLMAVRHAHRPWFGLQFHPESILTPLGMTMIANFVRRTRP